MSNINMVFNDPRFGKLRVVEYEGQPMFVARDVALALGYADTKKAVRVHCKKSNDFRGDKMVPSATPMKIIPESDVFRLVMRSNLPRAVEFQDWVCEEILPAIRKTGGYLMARPTDSPEEILARAVLVAQDTIKRVEQQRDEAIRTKAEIGSRREATAMATASAAVRQLNNVKEQLGLAGGYRTVRAIPWLKDFFRLKNNAAYTAIGMRLSRISKDNGYLVKRIPDTTFGTVNAYCLDAIDIFHSLLYAKPSLMKKYRYD